jgi:glycosyltransferase involved in cell wall biosynthesis
LIGRAKAVIVPGEEDFGLVPLEAAASGTPAIALRAGGALETIVEGVTGTFFDRQDPDALAHVLRTFDARAYDAARLRAHAEQFSPPRFIARLRELIDQISKSCEDGARRLVAPAPRPSGNAERT